MVSHHTGYFFQPNFMPIFFHVFSCLPPLGLWKSLDGGVIGGVMGSQPLELDGMLPESSVRCPEAESPLVDPRVDERCPVDLEAPNPDIGADESCPVDR